jgi:hypothetical protein
MSELAPALRRLQKRLEEAGWESEETHISLVLLGGDEVWKIKKPVALGFLDFSTLERRRAACAAEVRLNRRLTTDVYLGVEPITRRGDELRLGGGSTNDPEGEPGGEAAEEVAGSGGEVVEWAVHMRRVPRAARADVLLGAGRFGHAEIEHVARALAAFHAEARADLETARFGDVAVVEGNVRENFRQVAPFLLRYLQPAQAGELRQWQLDFLARNRALLERRAERDRVRDGHGDLRLDHVYFEGAHRERLSILDCIEFNDRFRFADVCADLAFLAMDLAAHGRVDLAEALLARYAEASDDFDLFALVDFYESYRAFVRGKILGMMIRSADGHDRVVERSAREARRYFRLALACGKRPLLPPRLIAVGGSLATGKSTISRALGVRLSSPVISADATRKAMLGIEPDTHQDDAPFSGAYRPEVTEEVYRELRRRAQVVVASGRSVILDASFRSRIERAAARSLAESMGVPFLFVECRAAREVVEARLRERRAAGVSSVSDGRLEILDELLASWDSISGEEEDCVIRVDTTAAGPEGLASLWELLPRWPDPPAAGSVAR